MIEEGYPKKGGRNPGPKSKRPDSGPAPGRPLPFIAEMTKAQAKEVAYALAEVILSDDQCIVCGGRELAIGGSYTILQLQPDIDSIIIGRSTIPSVPVVCGKCGYIRLHALGPLGLLPKKEKR